MSKRNNIQGTTRSKNNKTKQDIRQPKVENASVNSPIAESTAQQRSEDTPPPSKEGKECEFMRFIRINHSLCFSIVILSVTIVMGCFLWCANSNLKASQNKILGVFEQAQKQTESNIQSYIKQANVHRNELESCIDKRMKLLTSMCKGSEKDSMLIAATTLFVKLEADIKILEEQNSAITKLSADSLTRKYEFMMSNVLSEKMLELHLAKIEHEYTNITIWAAVLTIVFLIFSFFSLFKIEQSRKEIEDARDEINKVKSKAKTDLESTIDNALFIKSDIQTQHESEINTYKSGLKSLLEEYTRLLEGVKNKEEANNE